MKNAHLTFRSGNVIKTPTGEIAIVISVSDSTMGTIPFAYENMKVTSSMDDYTHVARCGCVNEYLTAEDDCERCHGSGKVAEDRLGYGRSVILAPTVEAFIRKRLMRLFDAD
jgi:hypothetical protein